MVKTERLRKKRLFNWFDVLNVILLGFLLIVTVYPFVYILALSFNDGLDTLKGGIWLVPRDWTLVN